MKRSSTSAQRDANFKADVFSVLSESEYRVGGVGNAPARFQAASLRSDHGAVVHVITMEWTD